MVALDVVYLFVPSTHDPILIVLPALAAVAALIGVLRQRPRPGWPWWLVVGALGTAALSGLLHIVGDGWFLRGRASPDPYGVTVLATLLLAVAALAAFAYLRQPGARTWIIDTVLIGGIALLLGWLIVVVPTFGAGFTAWQKTMQVVLPFCGAVLIALAAPLVRRRGTVSASAVLLAAGAVAALVTIALFVVGQVRDISAVSRPYFWWHLFCIAWAAAALDGSMKAVAVPLPAPSRQRHPMLWALAVVVLGFAGPIIAIAQYLQEEPEDYNNWLLLITVVLFVLVLGRFGATVASTARERHSRVERELARDARDAVLVADTAGFIVSASGPAARLLGVEDLVGHVVSEFLEPGQSSRVLAAIRRTSAGTDLDDWPMRLRLTAPAAANPHPDVDALCRILPHRSPVPGAVVLTLRDVSDEARSEQDLRLLSRYDPLTGLSNLSTLRDRLDRALREAGTGPVTLALLEVEGMRAVNAGRGRAVGDQVLRAVARRLEVAAPGAAVARVGGDEFAVLWAPPLRRTAPDAVLPAVRAVLTQTVPTDGGPVDVRLSLGTASTEHGPADGAYALLARADQALESARGAARHPAAAGTAPGPPTDLRSRLDAVLASGELEVRYQPVVDLRTRQVRSFEALVRWPESAGGPIGPDVLIPFAEETGQIVQIGAYMLRAALASVTGWNRDRAAADRVGVAVNVSAQQLGAGFPALVEKALADSGAEPSDLVLEVTESTVVSRTDLAARESLVRIRQAGVRVAIDDFGTGYSALRYLAELPADIVKIDKSFTDRLPESARMAALVQGIVQIADRLGLDTVAEGVETSAQAAELHRLGCRKGQGYLFARPLVLDAAVALLAEAS
ncbi:hypothetical protein GCM10009839_65500 [Catenulispora yoronensis]|uniref:PAS domain S-box-containing protein/diguanylate cyclase (GGDEF) domain-containing protein n=2 Tax=Catenulispora yoronensis TaxID=450799 RepID=A0ABN2V321_9ACTN